MPQADRHIRRSRDDYTEAFAALLPRGAAWPRQSDTLFMTALRGLAQIWGFIDSRAADLLERESDPRRTVELLEDWERNWGLPEPCFEEPMTLADRQNALVTKMTMIGAQSRAFFTSVAAQVGYVISISEFSPFTCGLSRVGDTRWLYDGVHYQWQIGPPEIRFYWTCSVMQARLSWFRCSAGQCGVDPHLRIGVATDLECLLNKWKPAHTQIMFDYSGLAVAGPLAGTP